MVRRPIVLVLALTACAPSDDAAGGDTAAFVEDSWAFAPASEDGRSVAAVVPERYLGLWYEIATTPSFIEADCHGTTAEYGIIDEDTISVRNRCYLGSLDGELDEIEGTADFADDSYARLLVDFGFGFLAPYDIVELDGADGTEPYRFAAVNSANFQIWILSRTPTMDPVLYAEVVDRMTARGLRTDELMLTEQPAE